MPISFSKSFECNELFTLVFSLLAVLMSLLPPSAFSQKRSKPNIIIILADDMGYSDLSCMGSEIRTPHLDQLAQEGVLFTHCYNTSRCCPSRASLQTGLYQHQAGLGYMDSDLGLPSYQGRMNENCVTLAELLREEGYRTIMAGKWHLGHEEEHAPLGRGYERMYGIPKGGGVYFYPPVGLDRPVYRNEQQVFPDSSWYSTEAFTQEAIEFTQEAKEEQKPFFLYLAYIAPHFPLQARKEDIQKYQGKYDVGYGQIRKDRFERQKELGIVSPATQLSPPEHAEWKTLADKEQQADLKEVYAAQVDNLDQNIGLLVQALKEQGQYENTVIFFLSDNGAVDADLNHTPEAPLGSRDSFAAYGKSWGNVSNTPYRKYKRQVHEGGIITPLIVHWPEGIKEQGLIKHQPIHINDFMPTCLALAQREYPVSFAGKELIPLAGESFLPLLHGKRDSSERPMFWEHEGNQAVRIGNWKLVKGKDRGWELYNIAQDPTELEDLASRYREKATALREAFESWAAKVGVEEWPVKK